MLDKKSFHKELENELKNPFSKKAIKAINNTNSIDYLKEIKQTPGIHHVFVSAIDTRIRYLNLQKDNEEIKKGLGFFSFMRFIRDFQIISFSRNLGIVSMDLNHKSNDEYRADKKKRYPGLDETEGSQDNE